MKKILIFSTAYLPLIGGAEVAIKEITDRLAGDFSAQGEAMAGWEFDLICARIKKNLPKREKIGRVNIYRLGWGCFLDKYYLALRGHYFGIKLHKENNYYAIWAMMASFGGFAAMFFKKKNPGIPFLLTLQEGDPLEYIKKRVGVFNNLFLQIFTRADYIQAISNFLADWAKNMGAKCPVDVVPNGVDLNLYSKNEDAAEQEILKKQFGKKSGDKFIIHTGRLTEKNGLTQIIAALVFLPGQVKFLAIGGGEDLEKLKNLAKKLKVDSRVIFAGEFPYSQMVKFLRISDIFVRPSLSEGLGNSFLEAMAVGLPVIGTRVGGIPDFILSGETGLFCEVKNPDDLAKKIRLLLEDDDLSRRLAKNGQELVLAQYDWNTIALKMNQIFTRLEAIVKK